MNTLDGVGVHGFVLHYSMVIAFVSSSFLVFLYLWRKGQLDMDEEPKHIMMQSDDNSGEKR